MLAEKNITKIKKSHLTHCINSSILMEDFIKTLKQVNNEFAESLKKAEQEFAEWFERYEKRKLELERKMQWKS